MKTKDFRYKFVKKWIRQAKGSMDPYDRFICFWTAMTIAAQIHRLKHRLHQNGEDTNREKILNYFVKNKSGVFKVIKKNRNIMTRLAQMKGPKYKDPIIDTGNPELRNRFSEIVRYYAGQIRRFSQERMAENMAELVSTARYTIFRTRRAYDMNYDKALLKLLNLLIADILERYGERGL